MDCPCGNGAASEELLQQRITDGNGRFCPAYQEKNTEIRPTVAFAELPAPQTLRNVSEHTATINIGNGSIDLYQEMGPELLGTLVELLKSC